MPIDTDNIKLGIQLIFDKVIMVKDALIVLHAFETKPIHIQLY